MAISVSKLEAVNEVLEAIGEWPAAALDSSGTYPSATYGASLAGRAEQFLDRESRRVQSEGWAENTTPAYTFTADSSGIVDLTASGVTNGLNCLRVLSVAAAGPDGHRTLMLRGDSGTAKIYDNNKNTFAVTTNAGSVVCDVVVELAFDDISPRLKDVIIGNTKVHLQRRLNGSQTADGFLITEAAKMDNTADRAKPRTNQLDNLTSDFAQAMARSAQSQRSDG